MEINPPLGSEELEQEAAQFTQLSDGDIGKATTAVGKLHNVVIFINRSPHRRAEFKKLQQNVDPDNKQPFT